MTQAPPVGTALFSLAGKTALVTGAVRGLGLEIARGFAQAGATLIVHGRQPADVAQAVQQLADEGLHAHGVAFDLNDHARVAQALDELQAAHGPIHVLCNNAGVRDRRGLQALSMADVQRVIDTNLIATVHLCQAYLARLPAGCAASILNITSLQGQLMRDADFAYPISKQGVETMTRAIAVEYGPKGVRCNAIAPGSFATAFNAQLLDKPENQARLQRNPLRRWGQPHEIVGPALFLVSDAASYVNGVTLTLDGGYGMSF
ncbi:SDR family oxidoreductase [Comamonas serinivorans]|nr:SDR family oxidoreductase [Comamonas serinivorans]